MPETVEGRIGQPPYRYVELLVNPQVGWEPFGNEHPLSVFLYKPMEEGQSADPMIRFIDETSKCIQKPYWDHNEGIGSETNQLIVDRLAYLVVDAPLAVPESERLRAWEYFLGSDWVNLYSEVCVVDRALQRARAASPQFAEKLEESILTVLVAKIDEFEERFGFKDGLVRPELPVDGSKGVNELMRNYDVIRKSQPEALGLYNTIINLALRYTKY